MSYLWLIVIAFFSAAVSWLTVGWLRRYLLSRKIIDLPNERTLHQGEVPRGGGIAIVGCLLITLLMISYFSNRPMLFIGLSMTVLAWSWLSWWDDKYDISPTVRIVIQMLFATIGVAAFGWIDFIQLSETVSLNLAWTGPVLTIIGLIWLANLYNFMDGMDGMAAAQAITASITLAFWFWYFGDFELVLVCIVLASANYGFLLWNWQPAKIFMGDVGSVTQGAVFATLLIVATTRFDIPVISLIFIFAVFVLDTSVVLIRRVVKREPFWLAHRTHYYQRLASAGVAHAKIVLGAVILMLLCSFIATVTLVYRDTIPLGLATITLLMVMVILYTRKIESHSHDSIETTINE